MVVAPSSFYRSPRHAWPCATRKVMHAFFYVLRIDYFHNRWLFFKRCPLPSCALSVVAAEKENAVFSHRAFMKLVGVVLVALLPTDDGYLGFAGRPSPPRDLFRSGEYLEMLFFSWSRRADESDDLDATIQSTVPSPSSLSFPFFMCSPTRLRML